MAEITFTELRQFGGTSFQIRAITKFNGLIFIAVRVTAGGQIWTHNPITGRFLLNSTFAGDFVSDFLVIPETTNASFIENTLWAVTAGTDGKLYIYDNDGTWTEKADSAGINITSLAFYENSLYYGSSTNEVLKFNGAVQTISLTSAEAGSDISAVFVFDDLLFAANTVVGAPIIFVFDNVSWAEEDTLTGGGVNQVNKFQEFNGDLYASTPKSGASDDLWKRDDGVSPVNWIPITSTSEAGIESMAVFMDKLYFSTITDDSIQRYDGTNFDTIKTAVTGISSYFAAFADGDDCLYFGSVADSFVSALFAMCPRCSDQVLISGASPFGWNVGDCDITPEICLIEDGCFCQIINTSDTTTIQIQWNGPGTPHLAISDIETGVESSITAFVNIVGNIWEVDIDVSTLNCDNIQLIVTTRTATDTGEWIDISVGGVIDLETVYVSSLTRIYLAGSDASTPVLKRSDNQGSTFTDKSQPSNGSNGVRTLTHQAGGGSEGNVYAAVRTNGFGSSTNGLDSYAEDTSYALGELSSAHGLNTVHVIVMNINGSMLLSSNGGNTFGALANSPALILNDYTDVYLTSSIIFFACVDDTSAGNGKIYSTTDGGATAWVNDFSGAPGTGLNGIHMASTTVGWAVGRGGTIIKTTDGSTWVAKTSGTSQMLNAVWFANTLIGWIVGENSTVLKTIDGGDTWVAQPLPNSANLNAVDGFLSGSSIFVVAVGDNGRTYRLNSATALTGVDVAITECIKVKNDFDCGLLVKYTNDDNFADFDYTNGLVNQIRLEAHFWRVTNPTEKSIHVTSAEEVIPTRQVVKKQIMLETDIMPEYMHEKLSIIFSHAAIEIEGITYVAEEGYEHDPFPKNFRQAKGHVLLTDKTYTKENIF